MLFYNFPIEAQDAWHDALGDIKWKQILRLLDKGDKLAVGEYLANHFGDRMDEVEKEAA